MTVAPTRWVSCGVDVNPVVAPFRHLTLDMSNHGWVTTFCGATGTPGAMLTNSTKDTCPECIKRADRNTLLRAPRRSRKERGPR